MRNRNDNNRPGIFILGPGRIGLSLSLLLKQSGFDITGIWGRVKGSLKEAERLEAGPLFHGSLPIEISGADIIFITTIDGAVESVAIELSKSGHLSKSSIVFHCSGVYDTAVLDSLKDRVFATGTIHPLQAVPSVEKGMESLPVSWFTLRGDTEAVAVGKKLVTEIGGRFLVLSDGDSALYHAAAVMASNYMVTLLWSAAHMMAESGLEEKRDAVTALLPMVRNVVDTVEELGAEKALTGPIARGDDSTLKRQLEALAERIPDALPLFLELAEKTVDLAGKKGEIDEAGIVRLRDLLHRFKI